MFFEGDAWRFLDRADSLPRTQVKWRVRLPSETYAHWLAVEFLRDAQSCNLWPVLYSYRQLRTLVELFSPTASSAHLSSKTARKPAPYLGHPFALYPSCRSSLGCRICEGSFPSGLDSLAKVLVLRHQVAASCLNPRVSWCPIIVHWNELLWRALILDSVR